jgi:hypothetical protein
LGGISETIAERATAVAGITRPGTRVALSGPSLAPGDTPTATTKHAMLARPGGIGARGIATADEAPQVAIAPASPASGVASPAGHAFGEGAVPQTSSSPGGGFTALLPGLIGLILLSLFASRVRLDSLLPPSMAYVAVPPPR